MDEAKRTLQGMTIKVGEVKYTIPITSIRQSLKVGQENLLIDPSGNEMLSIHKEVHNLVRLYEFFNTSSDVTSIEDGIAMLLEDGGRQLYIFADEIIGETDVAVHPLPEYLPEIAGISGCSIINDEEIYLIVKVSDFFDGDAPENGKTSDESGEPPRRKPEQELNDELRNKYFTFEIDGEEYGIEVANVKEIIGVRRVTRVPGVPDDVEGVISLRGEVIPIINVRRRFHKAKREHDAMTSVIVVNYLSYAAGLVVDSVKEVVYIDPDNISYPPSAKVNYHNQFISKLGKTGDNVKQLIELEKLLFL